MSQRHLSVNPQQDLRLVHAKYRASVLFPWPSLYFAFQKHSAAADITSSLSEDQVPEAFLVMVLIQFGTMVVDRALYLKKTVMGKVIFQVILVFGIHFWMFFILPGVTERYKPYKETIWVEYWCSTKFFVFKLEMFILGFGIMIKFLFCLISKQKVGMHFYSNNCGQYKFEEELVI